MKSRPYADKYLEVHEHMEMRVRASKPWKKPYR